MGWIVEGYCHGDIADARLHFYSEGMVFSLDRTTDQVGVLVAGTTAPSADSVRPNFLMLSGNAAGTNLVFPICDVSLEDQFMPWAGAPSSGGGSFLDFELGPELTVELILAAAMVYAIAWCCRVGRGLA